MKNSKATDQPYENKFIEINSLSELPDDHRELLEFHKQKILDQVLDSRNSKNEDAKIFSLVEYMAFQSLQIDALQKEFQAVFNALLEMAKVIDSKADAINS